VGRFGLRPAPALSAHLCFCISVLLGLRVRPLLARLMGSRQVIARPRKCRSALQMWVVALPGERRLIPKGGPRSHVRAYVKSTTNIRLFTHRFGVVVEFRRSTPEGRAHGTSK
jgi:hypothetical protein